MAKRRKNIDSMETDSIQNYLNTGELFRRYMELSTQIHDLSRDRSKPDLVELHKEKLGLQDFTWNGEKRFWVWHGPEDKWRVFVANGKGISFEVALGTVHSGEEALALYEEYAKVMLED